MYSYYYPTAITTFTSDYATLSNCTLSGGTVVINTVYQI